MADEVTSHNSEVLVICIRFVDKDCNIRESFLGFSKIPLITGAYITDEIRKVLNDNGF